MTNQNALLNFCKNRSFQTEDDATPFDKISPEDFVPSLESAIQIARNELQELKKQSAPLTFENVIVKLESSTELVEIINLIFTNLLSAECPDKLQSLAAEMAQKSAALQSEISLDSEIFKNIKALFDSRAELKLNTEETQVLEKTYKAFVRNGALLSDADKEKIRLIDQELSSLAPQFADHTRSATNAYIKIVDNSKDLEGLPEGAIEAAALEAQKRNLTGKWVFTLQAPSYIPVLEYAKNRELRKDLWMASGARCLGGEFDNQPLVMKITELREKRAQILGFKTHADFTLQERMAKTSPQVFDFMQTLLVPSKKAAARELDELREFKKSLGESRELESWDFAYYSEKFKESRFQFSEEELRPYFQLENVIAGVFKHAELLYNLEFTKRSDLPVYHPDVEVYEVRKTSSKEYVGLFYTDFFPRETKRGGAWMTLYRSQGLFANQVRRPHVSIVCNFTKPTKTKPSLLSYDEVQTLFHEFGHAIHGLLSNVRLASVASPNVYWDFVELPSQIMENWVREKEGLDLFAKHFETGEKIPADLIRKIKSASRFQAGSACLRQLQIATLDMKWHTTPFAEIKDVVSFEVAAIHDLRLFPYVQGTNISCSFGHIFSGGYSAGYYSYKWAEVLDADAFEYFLEKGIFSKEVAQKFANEILSRGGTEHPMDLYKKFRGREPDTKALIRRMGLEADL